jgi:hypothetical protein
MSDPDDDSRWALGPMTDERTVLAGFLEFQRDALERKLAGLGDLQLRMRSVPPSEISLIGLVRHIASVERWYFQNVLTGSDATSLYIYETNEAFLAVDQANGAEALATWRAECAISRRIADSLPLDTIGVIPGTQQQLTLRWIMIHMIDEYARHLGHADLVREAIDGSTGE